MQHVVRFSIETLIMYALRTILSGEWLASPQLLDYRSEWLSNMLVERGTWAADAPQRSIGKVTIAGPGYMWLRFWLLDNNTIVEKYFNSAGVAIGCYVPIGMPLLRRNHDLRIVSLILALWLQTDNRVTVLNEAEFEAAVASGAVAPLEAEQAEFQIRELTRAIAQKRFPPPLVRNFALE